jgi:hypothetical protein
VARLKVDDFQRIVGNCSHKQATAVQVDPHMVEPSLDLWQRNRLHQPQSLSFSRMSSVRKGKTYSRDA